MKRRTFYKLSLVLPYLLLAISLAIVFLTKALDTFFSSPSSLDIFLGVLAFFGVSGIIWGPLYTWMVVVMLIWGRNRSTEDIRRLYLLSPVLLACSTGIFSIAISMPDSLFVLLEGFLRMNNMEFVASALFKNLESEMVAGVVFSWLFMASVCLVVGYAFVGVVVWVERVLDKRGVFKDESDALSTNPPYDAVADLEKTQSE